MNNFIFKYLLSPSSNINYNFIASTYAFFSLLSLTLYALETQVFVQLEGSAQDGGDSGKSATMKELAESTKGLYLIFAPFIPCFFWSLIIRHGWSKAIVSDDGKEKKKKE